MNQLLFVQAKMLYVIVIKHRERWTDKTTIRMLDYVVFIAIKLLPLSACSTHFSNHLWIWKWTRHHLNKMLAFFFYPATETSRPSTLWNIDSLLPQCTSNINPNQRKMPFSAEKASCAGTSSLIEERGTKSLNVCWWRQIVHLFHVTHKNRQIHFSR